MERYELPIKAACALLTETTRRVSERGKRDAMSNLEFAVWNRIPISVVFTNNMAWLEAGSKIGNLYPYQAWIWLKNHGYIATEA